MPLATIFLATSRSPFFCSPQKALLSTTTILRKRAMATKLDAAARKEKLEPLLSDKGWKMVDGGRDAIQKKFQFKVLFEL